jgi:hypothetical protein
METVMQERWNALREALNAFHKKVQDDGHLAGQIASEIHRQFSAYINAPDNRRVRAYKVGHNPTDLNSYIEEVYPPNAVEQTPMNQWQFGLGILIGPEQFPEFVLRWPLYITVSKDAVLVMFSDKKMEIVRGPSGYDCEPLCALMYNSLVESFLMSAGSMPPTKFGFVAN